MNKTTKYLYVMNPTFVSGAMSMVAIEIVDLADRPLTEREAVLAARASPPRSETRESLVRAMTRFPQTLVRASKRFLQRRSVQTGVAA
jgi:hypothetical protein